MQIAKTLRTELVFSQNVFFDIHDDILLPQILHREGTALLGQLAEGTNALSVL